MKFLAAILVSFIAFTHCIQFEESDLDPNSPLSTLLNLDRLINFNPSGSNSYPASFFLLGERNNKVFALGLIYTPGSTNNTAQLAVLVSDDGVNFRSLPPPGTDFTYTFPSSGAPPFFHFGSNVIQTGADNYFFLLERNSTTGSREVFGVPLTSTSVSEVYPVTKRSATAGVDRVETSRIFYIGGKLYYGENSSSSSAFELRSDTNFLNAGSTNQAESIIIISTDNPDASNYFFEFQGGLVFAPKISQPFNIRGTNFSSGLFTGSISVGPIFNPPPGSALQFAPFLFSRNEAYYFQANDQVGNYTIQVTQYPFTSGLFSADQTPALTYTSIPFTSPVTLNFVSLVREFGAFRAVVAFSQNNTGLILGGLNSIPSNWGYVDLNVPLAQSEQPINNLNFTELGTNLYYYRVLFPTNQRPSIQYSRTANGTTWSAYADLNISL